MKPKKNICSRDEGFLVQAVFLIFYFLERCSVFFWLRKFGTWIHERMGHKGKAFVNTYIFPEIWVVGNIVAAILFEFLARRVSCRWFLVVMTAYAIERVLEMFVYQVNVLFFHRLNSTYMRKTNREEEKEKNSSKYQEQKGDTEYRIKSATRTVLMLILNMIEYILQFAVIFAAVNSLWGNTQSYVGIAGSFRVFMNMTNPDEFSGNVVLSFGYIETVIGMFMNIICLARFVGILPEVKEVQSRQTEEKK